MYRDVERGDEVRKIAHVFYIMTHRSENTHTLISPYGHFIIQLAIDGLVALFEK